MFQNNGLKRNTIDKFYTKKEITILCYNYIKNNIVISFENDLIIEPSAGNGAFIDIIEKLSKNNLFFDIKPENNKIIKKDFLEYIIEEKYKTFSSIHIIGNPPFGRQSSLAIKFIKKSMLFCNSISFILPKSFKKESMKSKFDINFHLVLEIDIPKNSFELNNIEYDVPCVFQIWIKKDFPRIINKKLYPENFSFVKKNENPDISFRRVGFNAGNIDKNTENKSEQSHYFIKFNSKKKDLDSIIKNLSKIIFEENNTVGPKSISKQELIKEFNQKINL